MAKNTSASLIFLIILILIPTSTAISVQIIVFCSGSPVFNNGVSVSGSNPTALDAIKASGVSFTGYSSAWGYYLNSIAGCGGEWGPAFMVNGAASPLGVSGYEISDGDQLIFLGPNSASSSAKYLILENVPDQVEKGEAFRIRVMEQDGYGFAPETPSSRAEVSVGNITVTTDSNGFTPDIALNQDAYFCVAATKSGYVPSYYFAELPYIQCGDGGLYICSVTGEGLAKGNIYYDEVSSINGQGFSRSRCYFENPIGEQPARSAKVSQKGSGEYNVEKMVKQRPGKIDIGESSELKYSPTAFNAYDRPLGYASKYEDSISQKNYQKGSILEETYLHLDYINKDSAYNNSDTISFSSQSDFTGLAELRARDFNESTSVNMKKDPDEESYATYIGSFQVFWRGTLPITVEAEEEEDCEEACQKKCEVNCTNCEDYCEDQCVEYCFNQSTDEYVLLPCCDYGPIEKTTWDGSCKLCGGDI